MFHYDDYLFLSYALLCSLYWQTTIAIGIVVAAVVDVVYRL